MDVVYGKILYGKQRHKWENGIKMDHSQIEYDDLENKWVDIWDKCSAMCLT
jgi:hypothetical protein